MSEQHSGKTDPFTHQVEKLVNDYLYEKDWLVKENANVSKTFTGLVHYITLEALKKYSLEIVYCDEAKWHKSGDIHIHDSSYAAFIGYCAGWSIRTLFKKGLITPTIVAKPAKHLDSAVDHIANFLCTAAHEWAGAQAFSKVDLYLAPFVKHDGLSGNLKAIKQSIQRLVYNLNFPSRVGAQCLSEDTKILTPEGWKSYNEVKIGDLIYTFNVKTGEIELKPVRYIYVAPYKGKMYNLRNRTQDQLISPGHRVVWKSFNSNKYRYTPIEELLNYKSPIPIPTPASTKLRQEDYPVSDNELKLVAWILSEGSIEKEKGKYPRATIYQSDRKHPEYYKEIIEVLNRLNLRYSVHEREGLGHAKMICLDNDSSRRVVQLLGKPEKKPPKWLYRLSRRQARLFIETYTKGDGWVERSKSRIRITTTDKDIAEALVTAAILAGYNVSVATRKPKSHLSKKMQYIISLTDTKTEYIQEIREVEYEGIVWSVNTENETVIAMRNGCVFITGNTPFTNFTFVLDVVPEFLEEPAVIGGEELEPLGCYLDEAIEVVKAFTEVFMEGDSLRQPFTFPIPTLLITRNFDWNCKRWGELSYEIWELAAHRGSWYFLNGVNGVDPKAIYSMCCRLTIDKAKMLRFIDFSNNIKTFRSLTLPENKPLMKHMGGTWSMPDETGSIGVVTLNMARIGYLSKGNDDELLKLIDERLEVARKHLMNKRRRLEKILKEEHIQLPITKAYLGTYAKHYNTIGLTALPEFIVNFLQEPEIWGSDITRRRKNEIISLYGKVLKYILNRVEEFEKEDGCLYNVEETPAEGAGTRLAKADMRMFAKEVKDGKFFIPEWRGEPFYSNSIVPYYANIPLYRRVEIESEVQKYFTGGVMMHIFLGEASDPNALKNLAYRIIHNTKIVYFSFTPTQSICLKCGWRGVGVYWTCPKCNGETEVWSRIVGYYRPVKRWNSGRFADFMRRKMYSISDVNVAFSG